MKSLVCSCIVAGSLMAGVGTGGLHAQASREPAIAVSLGTLLAEHSRYGAGLSARVYASRMLTVRLGGSYSWRLFAGTVVCVEGPCDHRRFRDDRRVGADVRRMLGVSALFAHAGVGVSWPHVIGDVADTWDDCCGSDTRTPLGFGRIGIGYRSRKATHGRWLEAGVERTAATPGSSIYVRATFGIV